ncbi:MAG: CARDB domain-containing protein [Thermoplasmatota archaeon]
MGGAGNKFILIVILLIPVMMGITFMIGIFEGPCGNGYLVSAAVNPSRDPCPDLRVKSIMVQGVKEGMVDEGSTYHIVVVVENIGNATLPAWWEIEVKEFIDVVFYQLVASPLGVNATATFEFDVKVDNLGDWGIEVDLKTPVEVVEKDTSNNESSVVYPVREKESEDGYLFQVVCCLFWLVILGLPIATILTAYIILRRKSKEKGDMASYIRMIWDPTQGP